MLTRSVAASLGLTLSGSIPGLFGTAVAKHGHAAGYGPLVPDPAGLLSLPEGFGYTVVAEAGVTLLQSGEPTPSDADGTASFARHGGGTVLVNNHEIDGSEAFKVPHLPGLVYDETAFGGTTTIEVDGTGNRVSEVVSLAGTHVNCAGGRTPWETWLTCEETEAIRGKPHGYVFEVDPHDMEANLDPQPIRALGRFAHESVAVDPHEDVIYLTEDASNPNGLLYRWTPPRDAPPLGKGSLRALADDAGELDALQAFTKRGEFVPDLSVFTEPGTRLRARWAPVPDRTAATLSTRKQFEQVTRSRKLEGMWWGEDGAYFVASFARTSDGSAAQHDGQVWFLDPEEDRIELMLHFAYTPADQDGDPDGPDNITVSPYGGLILAEDGDGANHLLGSTDDGEVFFLARNDIPGQSEFTGPTFSRDGRTLFANVQSPGHVFAIRGPFRRQ
jgi:secreted PhoX family phosphatase